MLSVWRCHLKTNNKDKLNPHDILKEKLTHTKIVVVLYFSTDRTTRPFCPIGTGHDPRQTGRLVLVKSTSHAARLKTYLRMLMQQQSKKSIFIILFSFLFIIHSFTVAIGALSYEFT